MRKLYVFPECRLYILGIAVLFQDHSILIGGLIQGTSAIMRLPLPYLLQFQHVLVHTRIFHD